MTSQNSKEKQEENLKSNNATFKIPRTPITLINYDLNELPELEIKESKKYDSIKP